MALKTTDYAHLLSPLALATTATRNLPQPYVHAPHLELLSGEIVQLVRRAPGYPRRLLVMMPPRHGKSELCSHWTPVWQLALDPSTPIILTSYEAEFAAKWGRLARRTTEELYPILGTRIMEDSRAAHRWETPQRGGMTTAGVGGPITGKGFKLGIIDDPIKNAEEAHSEVMRNNLWEWWQTTFLSREEPGAVIILILTRWHEDDLAGRILNSPEAKYWRIINLTALAGDEDPLEREEGEALWPERYDEVELENKRAQMGSRAFESLYQQNPSPPEGAGIKRAWWQWYDNAPKLEAFDQVIQSWDPTFSDADSSDYVVGQVWGRIGNQFYALDCVRQRLDTPETIKAIKEITDKYPEARNKLIERSASGFAIIQLLQREMRGITPVGVKGKRKEVRLHWGVNSVAAVIERGQVFLPRDISWSGIMVDEAAQFPHGAHDDMVDAMVQAIQYLMPRAWGWENEDAEARAEAEPTNNRELLAHDLRKKIQAKIVAQAKRGQEAERLARFPGY
jgi:predicted phage terminase large subunit-like protein